MPRVRLLTAQAIVTALAQIKPCPAEMVAKLQQAADKDRIPLDHPFPHRSSGAESTFTLRENWKSAGRTYQAALEHGADLSESICPKELLSLRVWATDGRRFSQASRA